MMTEKKKEKLSGFRSSKAVIIQSDGKITFINHAAKSLLGVDSAEKVIGKGIVDFIPEDSRYLVGGKIEIVMRDRIHLYLGRQTILNGSGQSIEAEMALEPISGSGSNAIQLTLAAAGLPEDQDEPGEYVENELFREMSSGLLIFQYVEPDKLILVDGNFEAARLIGIDMDSCKGKDFEEMLPEERRPGIKQTYLADLKTGRSFRRKHICTFHLGDGPKAFDMRAFGLSGARMGIAFDLLDENWNDTPVLNSSPFDQRAILDSLEQPVVYHDTNLKIIWGNRAACNSVNKMLDEIAGQYCYNIWFGQDRPCKNCPLMKALESGQAEDSEINAPDGREWHIQGNPVRDKSGNIIGLVGVTLDITHQKQVEAELMESEGRFRAITEASLVGIYMLQDGIFKYVNPKFAEIFGYPVEDVINKLHSEDLTYEEDGDLLRKNLELRISGGVDSVHYELRGLRKNGEIINLEVFGTRINFRGKPAIMGTLMDITERKRAENALEDSRRELSVLLKNLPGMAYRCRNDEHWSMEFVSEGALQLTGYRSHYLNDNKMISYRNIIHSEDRERVLNQIQQAIAKKKPFQIEYRIVTADGHEKWVWEQGQAIDQEDDRVHHLEGYIIDINDKRQTEEELSNIYSLLIAAIEQIPAGVMIAEAPDVNIKIANSAALKIRGASRLPLTNIHAALHPQRWQTYFPDGSICFPEELPLVRAVLFGETINDMDIIIKRDSGEERWVSISAAPVRNNMGEAIAGVAVFPDITDRKRMEKELRSANDKLRFEQRSLKQKNIALKELLGQIDREKEAFGEQIQTNIDNEVMPIVNSIRYTSDPVVRKQLSVLTSCIEGMVSPFVNKLRREYARLTPRELEICGLIKRGLASKEIAAVLNISIETIHQQRKLIRRKLGLTNTDTNLTTYLNSI